MIAPAIFASDRMETALKGESDAAKAILKDNRINDSGYPVQTNRIIRRIE